ncbi:hypothetical protein GH714_028752 [Hevea brasiliensis]|uniref:Pectinesterase n=1 Tax=Hevea brasiliensis TaxID=3981 RepID=A0A6A6LX35_HEVBR|nr:hypothetical protein GH714_028752 [Hevea brasiliensis]
MPKQEKKAPQTQESAKQVSHIQRVIKSVCNATTYKETCLSSLKKEVKKNPSAAHPKEILKLAIEATNDEIEKVLDKASSFKFKTPREKAAFDDCIELIENAKQELNDSISHARVDVRKLTKNEPELNNWLSAVMSYQQTCIDGFPEGKLKSDMEKTFKAAKELTSNSLAMGAAHADAGKPKPNAVVAKDGSGDFKTIAAALAAMPAKYEGRYVIYVKAGVYDETVTVTKKMVNVTIFGDGSQKTIVTGSKIMQMEFRLLELQLLVLALGEGFMAQAIGFRNTAGPQKHQAVAVRVQADRTIFLNCRFEGYQDTLYVQAHRQYYRSCVVVGTIDFIFGDASAILQNCLILVRKPMENQQNIVTAQGRIDPHETTGIVLQNCRIEPHKDLVPAKAKVKSYLGRPWKEYSRTIIMESTIEDLIHPDGWLPWEGDKGLKTLYYAEFNNKGPGSKTKARVKWQGYHVISKEEAKKYTVQPFLQGDWITDMRAPVHFGLY